MSSGPSMRMEKRPSQDLRQMQRLIMLPQMQRAIQLLQSPILELATAVEAEIEQNPLLELDAETPDTTEEQESLGDEKTDEEQELSFDAEDFSLLRQLDEAMSDHFAASEGFSKSTEEEDKRRTFLESLICREKNLMDHLLEQAREHFGTSEEQSLAELVIGYIDESGFLTSSIEEISQIHLVPLAEIQEIVQAIQTFEPYGVGARNLQESLLIQLRCKGREKSLAFEVIDKHYDDLLHNRILAICKGLGCQPKELTQTVDREIAKLDLHPGLWFSQIAAQSIVPDVTITQEESRFIVSINDDPLPPFRLSTRYLKLLENNNLSDEARSFIMQKLASAKWFFRSIEQRNETLYRIAETLARRQAAFFSDPEGKLVPLTMLTVSEELELHESTIARAVSNKYVQCPRGLLPLRSFFTNALVTESGEDISSQTVKEALLELIKQEDKEHPLSDHVLSRLLKEKGIVCARRTVAKYRGKLEIGNALQRRVYK